MGNTGANQSVLFDGGDNKKTLKDMGFKLVARVGLAHLGLVMTCPICNGLMAPLMQ